MVPSGFKLVKELGAGSFGNVWLLHDLKDNHASALKAVMVCNSTQKMLVETEIDALCTVRGHPHILEMFEASICDGWALLRFAYCSGGRAVGCVTRRNSKGLCSIEMILVRWMLEYL